MKPLEEARKHVADTFRNMIRVAVITQLQSMNVGLENITEDTEDKANQIYDRIIAGIEFAFAEKIPKSQEDGSNAQALIYYAMFSSVASSFVIGWSMQNLH